MSRVGKRPIALPQGVTVKLAGQQFSVTDGKRSLTRELHPAVKVEVGDSEIRVLAATPERESKAIQGLTRTLVANMVHGLTKGFEKILEVSGVGYRVETKGKDLVFHLGYSHPVEFKLPEGVTAQVPDPKTPRVVLQSADKELLGLTAAKIRSLRGPEPYKGKGIRYSTETIRRKVGKSGAK